MDSRVDDRPDPLTRLDAVTDAIRGLHDLASAEEPLDNVLDRVADAAAQAIPDADAVTITVLTNTTTRTAAATHEQMGVLETQQQQAARGPCIEAARTGNPVRAAITERGDDRWPEFAAAAQRAGVRAYLSVPLLVEEPEDDPSAPSRHRRGRTLVGALNIYSYHTSAFDPFDERLMRLYSITAAQAITNARRWQNFRETITQLEEALTSRADIDQAKGILMALHGLTADEAFGRLVKQSQQTNTKVSRLARDFLASLHPGNRDDPTRSS